MSALGISALVVSGALMWVWLLRRRVQKQRVVIKEREAREQSLETRYRELFENATDIVYTLDLAGNLTSINPAGERILGLGQQCARDTQLPVGHTRQLRRYSGGWGPTRGAT